MIDEAALVAVQEFDGIFDGNQMVRAARVDAVDHRRQGRGFTRAGGPGHQHQAALLFANSVDHWRKIQFVGGANLGGNNAQNHTHIAALLKYVDAEAPQPSHPVRHIQFGGLFKFLLLAIGHHAERHGQHFFGSYARHVGDRHERAIHAQIGVVSDFQVQVGGLVFDRAAQQIVNT